VLADVDVGPLDLPNRQDRIHILPFGFVMVAMIYPRKRTPLSHARVVYQVIDLRIVGDVALRDVRPGSAYW
jgi:hypothetical protein